MYRRLRNLLLITATGLVTMGAATATTITNTSFQSWKGTITGSPNEADLSGIQFRSYNTAAGLNLSAIGNSSVVFNFTGPDNGGFQLSGTSYHSFTSLAGSADAGAGINVNLPSTGENAFILGLASTSGTPLTLTLSDGETFSVASGAFGVSISHPVTSFLLTTTAGSQVIIDDFWYGASSLTQDPAQPANNPGNGASDTPEGATLLLVSGGSLVLVGARRKFQPELGA
jgi:hypothetical protein